MSTNHESLFHHVFAEPANASPLLRSVLPASVAAAIDWSSLAECSTLLFDPELGKHEADLLFAASQSGRDTPTFLLIEHKSEPEPFAVLQLLRYALRVFEKWRNAHGDARRLPTVIPIVIHHCDRPWLAPTTLAELLPADVDEGMPALAFGFLLLDLARSSEVELLAGKLPPVARLAQLYLQCARWLLPDALDAALRRWQECIRAVAAPPGGVDALQVFHAYVLRVTDLPATRLAAVMTDILGPPAGVTVMSTADKLIAEGMARGLAKGKVEGRVEGKVEGKAEQLLRQLRKRFGNSAEKAAARIHAASVAELDQWALRILDAKSIAEVFTAE